MHPGFTADELDGLVADADRLPATAGALDGRRAAQAATFAANLLRDAFDEYEQAYRRARVTEARFESGGAVTARQLVEADADCDLAERRYRWALTHFRDVQGQVRHAGNGRGRQ